MTTTSLELTRSMGADAAAEATSRAFAELARRHVKEFDRLLSSHLRKAELDRQAPVSDSQGAPLEVGTRIDTPSGKVAKVDRVDRRSRRVVVRYHDGSLQMLTARRVTVKQAAPRAKKKVA